MLLQGGDNGRRAGESPFVSRFESIGLELPERRVATRDLMASTRHGGRIRLDELTGIEERRVCSEGEDTVTLAVSAAQDCLDHSRYQADDIEMLINCSISHYRDGLIMQHEPPLSLSVKQAIGAHRALSFDLTNACAGMMTGVFLLNDFIRRGVIRRGMVVSGEYITSLSANAAPKVRTLLSKHLASLTLGDAGAAVIVERAPEGVPGIAVAGFTTLAEHSRLCTAVPSKIGPGGSMLTKAREIHRVSIDISAPFIREALEHCGLDFDEIDYIIPHQTSARAIRSGEKTITRALGVEPKPNWVTHVRDHGNTASTTHFVALYRYLQERRLKLGDRIMLLSYASGIEFGVVVLTVDELVERYGHSD
jgi:3-oxoacyl-[acyl-carrier-protein] synthase-3